MPKYRIISNPDYNETRNSLLETMPDTPVEIIDHFILEDIIEWTIEVKEKARDIHDIPKLDNIYMLDMRFCERIVDLSPLAGLNIQHLTMSGCVNVTDLSPLASINSLIELNISSCDSITDLSPLANIRTLEILDISNTQITDLSPLAKTPIKKLIMYRCIVSDLSPLANTNLVELNIGRCTRITDLTPLENITTLKKLYTFECNPDLNTSRLEENGVIVDNGDE